MKKRHRKTSRPQMMLPYQAALPSPNRSMTFGPMLLNHRVENSRWLSTMLWAKARLVHSNSPELINLVERVALICGYITPRPMSADEEWNALALAAWRRRTADPRTHDSAQQMNDRQQQLWLERRAAIDGDALIVSSIGADGGAVFTAYEAPQVFGEGGSENDSRMWVNGVLLGEHGEPLAYGVRTAPEEKAEIKVIRAAAARLYRHHIRPGQPRGLSELGAAIDTAQDLFELTELTKAAIKLAASFGIVETKDLNDQNATASDFQRQRNGQAANLPTPKPFVVAGVQAYEAAPGRRVEIIHDTRPSNEQQAFRKSLEESIALVMGLPPEIVRFLSGLNSAASRTTLQIVGDWQRDRLLDREPLMQWKWETVITAEIAAGRLRPCSDPDGWNTVAWIPRTAWSIDRGRDGTLAINMAREGMLDRDAYMLATSGQTYMEVARKNIENYKRVSDLAAAAGVPLESVLPGALGATAPAMGKNPASNEEPDGSNDAETE